MEKVILLGLAVVLLTATVRGQTGTGTGTGTGTQQPTPCFDQFNENLAQRCFDQRGISFQGALNLLSQGQRGEIPANTTREALRALMCSDASLDFIIPCALQLASYYANQTTCAEQERRYIVGTAQSVATALTPFCLHPCEMETNQRAMRCFASAQIDPNRAMNTSMLSDKFIILGNTTIDIQRFCNNHNTVFTCLEAAKATCPAFEKRMYEEGVDFVAMKQATAVLCQKQQEYMNALQCFSQNEQVLQPCQMSAGQEVQQLLLGRLGTGTIAPSQMTGRLCKLRIETLLPCQLNAYRSTCAANLMQLRTDFECNMIAAPCRSDPTLQPIITQMCQSTPPPQQTITPKPNVVVPPQNRDVNTFSNNPDNVNSGNTINTNPMNNNGGNSAPVSDSNNNNGNSPNNAGDQNSGSIFVSIFLLFSALFFC